MLFHLGFQITVPLNDACFYSCKGYGKCLKAVALSCMANLLLLAMAARLRKRRAVLQELRFIPAGFGVQEQQQSINNYQQSKAFGHQFKKISNPT